MPQGMLVVSYLLFRLGFYEGSMFCVILYVFVCLKLSQTLLRADRGRVPKGQTQYAASPGTERSIGRTS